jgi:membrane-bound lytic murein transglycosylase D
MDKVVYGSGKAKTTAPAAEAAVQPAPKAAAEPAPQSRPAPVIIVKEPVAKPKASVTAGSDVAVGNRVFHTVKTGETAFGISRQYNISMKELMALNNLNFETIKVGQKLRVK